MKVALIGASCMSWTVYILECVDKTLYTGITNDLKKRLEKHAKGRGAKYTKGRSPLKLVYTEQCKTKSRALKREIEIKSLDREKKMELIKLLKGTTGQ